MLQICGVKGYVTGEIARPDPAQDPEGAENWDFNDTYARVLISNNITTSQMVHISQSPTSQESWSNLEAVHDAKSHQTTIGIIRNLYRTSAEEGDNISDHLNKLKRYWERINLTADNDFKVSDNQFKVLISSSLPTSWDIFTEGYVGGRKDVPETDPKKLMSSQQFIGIIKPSVATHAARNLPRHTRAFRQRKQAPAKPNIAIYVSAITITLQNADTVTKSHAAFARSIMEAMNAGTVTVNHPKRDPEKRKRGGKQKGGDAKRQKTEATHEAEEEDSNMHIEEVAFMTEEDNNTNSTTHVNNMGEYEKPLHFYDWLADSATTSHICNQKEAFISYKPVTGKTVAGVGNNHAIVEGRGTIELESTYKDYKYLLRLENVLHIPSNRNNLISLGHWDHAGGRYTGGGGAIILVTKDGKHVAKGTKIDNNLYKMKVSIRKPGTTTNKTTTCTPQTFQATEPTQSWETWHKRFGHIGYSGLQKLLDLNMVDGFTVDIRPLSRIV